MNIKTDFIPIDYDYFDFNGKNYVKIIGKTNKNKKACVIDSFEPCFWVILQQDVKQKAINKLIEKIQKISLDEKNRQTKVEKVELHKKNFLGDTCVI